MSIMRKQLNQMLTYLQWVSLSFVSEILWVPLLKPGNAMYHLVLHPRKKMLHFNKYWTSVDEGEITSVLKKKVSQVISIVIC